MEVDVLSPHQQKSQEELAKMQMAETVELSPNDLSQEEKGLFENYTEKIENGGEEACEAISNEIVVDYTEEARQRTEQLLKKIRISLEEEQSKSGLDKLKEGFTKKTQDLAIRFKNDWTAAMRGENYFQRRDALMETTPEDLTGIAEAYILSSGSPENFDKMGGSREFGYQEGLIPGKKLYTINLDRDPHLETAIKARAEEIRRQQKLNIGEYSVEKTPMEELERHLGIQERLRQDDREALKEARTKETEPSAEIQEKIKAQENEISQLKQVVENLQQSLENEKDFHAKQLAGIREQIASTRSSLENLSDSLGNGQKQAETTSEKPQLQEHDLNLDVIRETMYREFTNIIKNRGLGEAALRIETVSNILAGMIGDKNEAQRLATEEYERAKSSTETS